MSKLREIKRRITSVKNIEKVTHAMQMVAASRMRKAQDRASQGKAYTEKVKELLLTVGVGNTASFHPMFDTSYSDSNVVLLVVFSTQRGLAGGLPGNMLRHVRTVMKGLIAKGKTIQVVSIGKKIGEQLASSGVEVIADFSGMSEKPSTADIRPVTKLVEEMYVSKQVGSVMVIYSDFINPVTYVPVSRVLLPFDMAMFSQFDDKYEDGSEAKVSTEFVFEPNAHAILDALIPRYLETQMYQARLETVASEYSARMIAMKSATDNAKDLNESLKITLNKSRQAQITQEISEIVAASA